jgi:hypothetical protein
VGEGFRTNQAIPAANIAASPAVLKHFALVLSFDSVHRASLLLPWFVLYAWPSLPHHEHLLARATDLGHLRGRKPLHLPVLAVILCFGLLGFLGRAKDQTLALVRDGAPGGVVFGPFTAEEIGIGGHGVSFHL